jgi:molecular chaperone DnaK (HSP70)
MDHEGDVYLGGDDFDQLIVDYIRDKARKEQRIEIPDDPASRFKIKLAAEQAKKDLSSANSANILLPALGEAGITLELEITRQAFENMLMPWLVGPRTDGKKAIMELVRIAIQKSNLSPDLIDNILLVGGSTYIPLVHQVLSQEFGEKKVLRSVNPMLCVAHGAAIETSLITEIECPKCHHMNQLDAMKCEKCGYSLVGEEKIDCPVCFLPSPITERTCWKCGSETRSKIHIPSPQYKKCPQGHENALNATVCSKCQHVFEIEGIRCIQCKHVNKAKATVCEKCGNALSTRNEVTSKDKGIELNDGRFDVIVPKGTKYPTPNPIHKLYVIPKADMQHWEIAVYEGDSAIAKENEWLGDLVLELPRGLPEGTLVDISIHLDDDGSMVVSAKLVGEKPLIEVRARIERFKCITKVKRCAACGRPTGKSVENDARWCTNCLDVIAQFLTVSFHKANKLNDAETALSQLLGQTQNPVWQYYLGLVHAESGKLDTSIGLLQSLLDSNEEHHDLKAVLSSLLATRALLRLKEKDYKASIDDVSLLANLEPDNQDAARSLSLAKVVEAFLQIGKKMKSEELENVVKTWQKIRFQQPDNYTIIHNLAILSYRLASVSEEDAKEKIADKAWRDTIANWALLLRADSFWLEWADREKSLYQFDVSKDNISAVRQALRDRLLKDFENYRVHYYEVQNTDAVKRHKEYEVLFLLEMKTAKAMKVVLELLKQRGLSATISIPCGPLMLQTMNFPHLAHDLVAQARNSLLPVDKVDELENCLSPSGRIEGLIETNWFEQAEAELDKLLDMDSHNVDFRNFMAIVCRELGVSLAKAGDWEKAMDKLEKGLNYVPSDQELKEAIATACLDNAKQLSEDGDEKNINKAIKVLERGRKSVPENESMKVDLATHYARRGIINGNADKWEAATKDLERALKLDHSNGLALRSIAVACGNRAVELGNAEEFDKAIDIAVKGLRYGESQDLRRVLSQLHAARGIMRHNKYSDVSGCREDLTKALEYDPSNQHARDNLLRLIGGG